MRAAENGNSDAQFILGDRYSCGERQPRDLSKARKWYSMAAEQGDLEAKLKLANIDDEFRQSARPTYPNYNETPNDISAKPNKGFPLTIEFNSPAIRNGDLLEDIYISSIDGGIGKLASKYDRSGEHRFDIRPGVQFLDFDIYRRNHSVPNPEKFLGRFRISPCMTSHIGKSVSISVFFTMTDIKISLSPSSKLDDLKIARVY